jgi:two-component system, chemotaxis family, sensor kinase CheA
MRPQQKPQIGEAIRQVKAEGREVEKQQKDATIRVGVDLLDKIINQVSELVLVRNRLLQLAAKQKDNDLKKTVQGLNLLTTELRKHAMKARLQPVSNLFDKFPRIVRDTSQQCGKKIRLETVGGETELDKRPCYTHRQEFRRPWRGKSGGAASGRQTGRRHHLSRCLP